MKVFWSSSFLDFT